MNEWLWFTGFRVWQRIKRSVYDENDVYCYVLICASIRLWKCISKHTHILKWNSFDMNRNDVSKRANRWIDNQQRCITPTRIQHINQCNALWSSHFSMCITESVCSSSMELTFVSKINIIRSGMRKIRFQRIQLLCVQLKVKPVQLIEKERRKKIQWKPMTRWRENCAENWIKLNDYVGMNLKWMPVDSSVAELHVNLFSPNCISSQIKSRFTFYSARFKWQSKWDSLFFARETVICKSNTNGGNR